MNTLLQIGLVLLLTFFGSTFTYVYHPKATGCVADLNKDLPSSDPILLRPGVTYDDILDYENAFILPDASDGLLHIAQGESVRVVCPGNAVSLIGKEEGTAVCSGNNQFKVGSSTNVQIDKLGCKTTPTNVAVRKGTCSVDGTGIELGFEIDTMYPLVYICFNEKTMQTYWSMERVPAELKGYETGETSPSFKQDDFYQNLRVDDLYGYDNQITAFTKILGSQNLATKYIKDHNSYYLARGHFTPRADFVFGSHTRATFHFVNVNPQWQIFNGGVWNNLEMAVRSHAISSQTDFIGYTGPFGVLQYPDTNGKLASLYLANPGTSSQTLAVPKFYWKLLVDPATQKGVVFIGINDPYVKIPYPQDYKLCPDVLNQISWLNIKNTTWLYACEVQDFLGLSDTLPKVEVTGLLDS